jgi:hypothetical protein
MAKNQLVLIEEDEHEWLLDDQTRAVGRRGLAQARRALVQASRRVAA